MEERHQPSMDITEHVDKNWGFQAGKAVYPVEGVPTGGYKSNATIVVTTVGSVITLDKYILSGATICQFRRVIDDTEPFVAGSWTLV
jgi:hypothetical protein